MTNPSENYGIRVNEIFTDCEYVTKELKRALPFTLNPSTRFPLHFNLYVTSLKNRDFLKVGLYFNVTLTDQPFEVAHRMWLKEVSFQLLQNHLKLAPFEMKHCKKELSVITIKNP